MTERHLPRIAVAMTVVLLAAACGAASQSGPVLPSGSSVSPDPPAGSPDPPAGSDAAGVDLPPDLVEAILGAGSLERLAAIDRQAADTVDERTGLADQIGPDLQGWLAEQRSAAVQAALQEVGVDPSTLGPTARLVVPDDGALMAAGLAYFGTGMAAIGLVEGAIGHVGGADYSNGSSHTSTSERTSGGRHVSTTTTTSLQVSTSGSMIVGDAAITESDVVTDPGSGAALGSSTSRSRIHVEAQMCPDTNGRVTLTVTSDLSGSGTPAGTSFATSTTGARELTVGDDAEIASDTQTLDTTMEDTAADGTRRSGSASATWTASPGPGGTASAIGSSSFTSSGDYTPAEAAASQGLTSTTLTAVSNRVVDRARDAWRGGSCVAVEASERSRDVDGGETVRFDAWPIHKVDGGRLDKPLVGTLDGIFSLQPEDQEQPAPASLTFIAGPDEGDRGRVTLKSTSNRGIGELVLTFTVKPLIVLELEMDSTVTPTQLTGFAVNDGKATANGRIRLAEVAPGHWRGDGTLASRTTSKAGGCRTIRVRGQGTYDWQVRDVAIGPDVAAGDITVDIDAGMAVESPDSFTARNCPLTMTGTMNTWENLWFQVYNDRKNVNGLRVTGWRLQATPQTWTDGGLIATATWRGSCPAMVIPGVPGVPGDDDLAIPGLLECTDRTTFKLWAVRVAP